MMATCNFWLKKPPHGICEVMIAGPLKSRKGVSAPNTKLTLSAITEKDKLDIEFALKMKTDYIAMSFVRTADDIRQLRWMINFFGGDAAIIAKIEMKEALENIEDIIAVVEGIMVARGDLGVETPAERVPFEQKRIIKLCNKAGKPVITATQMLESMTQNPRPTRAEASDVYNAIIDGTDAVMLSAESASGDYPVRAVEVMANIARTAEEHIWDNRPTGREFNAQADGAHIQCVKRPFMFQMKPAHHNYNFRLYDELLKNVHRLLSCV